MSSKAKKIEEQAENYGKMKKYTMYGTVIGSCIVTIGKLAKKTEEDLVKDFDDFSDNKNPLWKCKTIKEVCDYLIDFYKVDKDKYKDNIVLVYDEGNVYTPIVTLEIDDTILPLDPNGMTLGILNHLDAAVVEYVYEEDEDCIEG